MFKKSMNHFFVFLLYFLFPSLSSSQIIFSEIMFNPDGTDAGHEWVEIENTQSISIDLEDYRFCEGSPTCHGWNDDENDSYTLPANTLAIITDDREKFMDQNLTYTGLLFVSNSFILNNTGELIQIKNPDGSLDDELTYNPESGGDDGNTLAVFDNIWRDAKATPGEVNERAADGESDGDSASDSESSTESSDSEDINTSYTEVSSDMYLGKKKLKSEIDEVGVVMSGAKSNLSGRAFGISGVEIYGIDFFWNFGDGEEDYGQHVSHEFIFPGEYIISLVVKSGNFTGNDKMKIQVIDPPIDIADVQVTQDGTIGYVEIRNHGSELLNIEEWIISVDGDDFTIPEGTYLDKNSYVKFANKLTLLQPKNDEEKQSRVFLKYPNGKKFFTYSFTTPEEETQKIEVVEPEPVVIEKIKIVERVVYKEQEMIQEEKQEDSKEILKDPENMKAEVYASVQRYATTGSEDFVKDHIAFLVFITILGGVICVSLYLQSGFQEGDIDGHMNSPHPLSEKEKYVNEIEEIALEYSIKEVKK